MEPSDTKRTFNMRAYGRAKPSDGTMPGKRRRTKGPSITFNDVDRIIDHETDESGMTWYKVCWEDQGDDSHSYHAAEEFADCPEVVQDYFRQIDAESETPNYITRRIEELRVEEDELLQKDLEKNLMGSATQRPPTGDIRDAEDLKDTEDRDDDRDEEAVDVSKLIAELDSLSQEAENAEGAALASSTSHSTSLQIDSTARVGHYGQGTQFEDGVAVPKQLYEASNATGRPVAFSSKALTFVNSLCTMTNTPKAERHIIPGMTRCVELLANAQLLEDLDGGSLPLLIRDLFIAVWLTVCLRISLAREPVTQGLRLPSMVLISLRDGALSATRNRSQLSSASGKCWEGIEYWEQRLLGNISLRRKWLNDPWYRTVPAGGDLFKKEPRNSHEKLLADAYKADGVTGLAATALQMELSRKSSPLTREHTDKELWVKDQIYYLLLTTEGDILKAMIEGNISLLSERRDSPVRKALRIINKRGDEYPATYGNFLVDNAGFSPTPAHLIPICNDILRYTKMDAEHDDWAWAVDKAANPPPKSWIDRKGQQGGRRYRDYYGKTAAKEMMTMGKWDKSEPRQQSFNYFAQQLLERCEEAKIKGLLFAPFSTAISEVGYAIKPASRLKHHASHRSSNRNMNLVEALLIMRYGHRFQMKQLILHNCLNHEQSWLGEIIFTLIIQSYTIHAHGFNHMQAGFSNWSSFRRLTNERWAEIRVAIGQGDRVVDAIDEETKRIEQKVKAGETTLEKRREFHQNFQEMVDLVTSLMPGV